MLIAVGFIVRLNVAILIFIGGGLAWLIGIPLLGGGLADVNPVDQAYGIWSGQMRYVGVGAMVVGGFSALIAVRKGLLAAVLNLWHGFRKKPDPNEKLSQRDIPSWAILALGSICLALLAVVNFSFHQQRRNHFTLYLRDAGHGFLFYSRRKLYRWTCWEFKQPRFRDDHHGCFGCRWIAVLI